MSSDACQLENYSVALEKNGVRLGISVAEVSRIEWGRQRNGVSTAKVDFVTAGAECCGQIARTDHWNTDLIITSPNEAGDDQEIWRGPVKKPTFRKGSVTVDAADVLAWPQVRKIEVDYNIATQDISDTAITLINYAMTKGGAASTPQYSIVRFDSGVLEARVIEASSNRMTWNVLSEMLDAGLDITTLGSQIIVGKLSSTPLTLKDTDVLGQVEVEKDGDSFTNRAIATASRDIVGIYPPGLPTGDDVYPLVEAMLSDSQLPDQASADAAAKAKYDFASKGVRRAVASGGLQLLPSSGIDPRTLLPGQLVNFAATETCYAVVETMRVGSVNVVAEKGSVTATITLQPYGEDDSEDL